MMDINDPFISRGVNIAASSVEAAEGEEGSAAGEGGWACARSVNCREKRTFEANGRMGWEGERALSSKRDH